MKYVVKELKRDVNRSKLPVIRIEIDYELMTLYDAMQANDHVQIMKSKDKLKALRARLLEAME
ncbi:hypothetical protein GCM10008983_24860 [Lentibacillus halophilus]|uniref:Uncharacterized protein n=1 Tax=Lentibacillus halophilus TaxID=295065 RepID=A0ABN0ZFI7_9BACI